MNKWKNNMCIKLECLIPSWKKAMSQKPSKFKPSNSIFCVEDCNCVFFQNDFFRVRLLNILIVVIYSTYAPCTCAKGTVLHTDCTYNIPYRGNFLRRNFCWFHNDVTKLLLDMVRKDVCKLWCQILNLFLYRINCEIHKTIYPLKFFHFRFSMCKLCYIMSQ